VSAGVVRALEQISREPVEKEGMNTPSSSADENMQIGTTLARTESSIMSNGSREDCSSTSCGDCDGCSVTTSSITVSSQPSNVKRSSFLESRPVKVSCHSPICRTSLGHHISSKGDDTEFGELLV
jgi:hypothetical protein